MAYLYRSANQTSGHRVVDVERSTGGLVIAFEDGRTAVFDTGWLYQQIPNARVIIEPDAPDALRLDS